MFNKTFIVSRFTLNKTFLSFIIVLLLPANIMADLPVGKVDIVFGRVTIQRPGAQKPTIATDGIGLFVGDIVRTDSESKARLTFIDDTFANLSSNTAIRVNLYVYETDKNRRNAVIKVLDGKSRFVVYKIMSDDSLFTVETDKAVSVANIADFVVTAASFQTEVAVLKGMVRVKNISSLTVGEVSLSVNQKTVVKDKTQPSHPAILTREQRKIDIEETLIK